MTNTQSPARRAVARAGGVRGFGPHGAAGHRFRVHLRRGGACADRRGRCAVGVAVLMLAWQLLRRNRPARAVQVRGAVTAALASSPAE